MSGEKNGEKSGRKIAVLGDMMELGKQSAEAHWKTGLEVGKVADILVTVGVRAHKIAEGALDAGLDEEKIMQLDASTEVDAYLQPILTADDVVLLKGSQSIRMERAVKEIMAEPEKCEELLVRQDAEWQTR